MVHQQKKVKFESARVFWEKGDFAAALEVCEEVLLRQPEHADAQHLIGLVYLSKSEPDKAAVHLLRAVALKSNDAAVHIDLGRAYNNIGDFHAAEKTFQQVLRMTPESCIAHNYLGHVRRAQGRLHEAIECFERALVRDRGYSQARHNLATVYVSLGRWEQAKKHFYRALSEKPEDLNIRYNLALLLHRMGDWDAAIEEYQSVLKLRPEDLDARSNLASAYQACGQMNNAHQEFQQVLGLDPKHQASLAGSAGLLDTGGDPDAAIDLLSPVVASGEASANVLVAYAQLLKRRESDLTPCIENLEQVLNQTNLHSEERATVHFCLGDLFDQTKKYGTAFQHYKAANGLRDPGFRIQDLRKLRQRSVAFFQACGNSLPRSESESQVPIFIVGMPRSGTSLVEQILASHSLVYGAGELRNIGLLAQGLMKQPDAKTGYPDGLADVSQSSLNELAKEYLDHLTDLNRDAHRITDKMWQNFEYLGLISCLFPKARVIHCIRHPVDTALSCYFQSFGTAGPPFSYDLDNIVDYFIEYRLFMNYWTKSLDLPILPVVYEELVRGQREQTQKILAFSGLEWEQQCLSFYATKRTVRTASSDQVRRPIYNSSIGRHKHYGDYIEPLMHRLQDFL